MPVLYGESRPAQSIAIERTASASAALIPYPAMSASASDTDGRRRPRSSRLIIGRDTPVSLAARVIDHPRRTRDRRRASIASGSLVRCAVRDRHGGS